MSPVFDEIILPDGSIFKVRSIDTINLHAHRLEWKNGDIDTYVENYHSLQISLEDIFEGDFEELISSTVEYDGAFWSKLHISGWTDKNLNRIGLTFYHIDEKGTFTHLASHLNTRYTEIGPGNFFTKAYISRGIAYEGKISDLPPGKIVMVIERMMIWKWSNYPDNWSFESIPADIPNGTIMATIRNLQIQPVF